MLLVRRIGRSLRGELGECVFLSVMILLPRMCRADCWEKEKEDEEKSPLGRL